MNEKRLKKYEYLSSKIRTQFFIILVIFLLPFIVLYFHLRSKRELIEKFINENLVKIDNSEIYEKVK